MLPGLADLLYARPTWQLAIGFFAVMMLACEVGFYWHRRSAKRTGGEAEIGDEAHVLAAALGLLALMIAFTFSMAQGRYEDRRNLVVQEANAMVGTYLAAQLLDQPGRTEMGDLLRRYADVRLEYFATGGDAAKIAAYDAASEVMHRQLWDTMLRATAPHRTTMVVGLVSQPLTRMIDLKAERRSARLAKVPVEVMQALIVYSVITALTLGYVMGGLKARHRIVATILFVLISVSIMVTLDLDSPASGGIRLSGEPLVSARAVLHTGFAAPSMNQ